MDDKEAFIEALTAYAVLALTTSRVPADYTTLCIEVVDARNHFFRTISCGQTDETEDRYALRELCHVDEQTMELWPDKERITSVARNYFRS